ncbi:MAG: hypothetical protein R2845_05570 [Thermomicrobiales bacterium]
MAIPLLAIASLDADAFDLSLLTAAALAPYLVAGLFIGVWVDRVRKRPLLIAAGSRAGDLHRGDSDPCLDRPVDAAEPDRPDGAAWHADGCLQRRRHFVRSIVPRSELPRANARLALSTSRGWAELPPARSLYLSAPIALVIDALSYLVSACSSVVSAAMEPP